MSSIFKEKVLKKVNLPITTSYDIINEGWDSVKNRYDTDTITTLNRLNNVLVDVADLSDYPSLADKVVNSAITNTEYSEFLFQSGIDPNSVKDLFLTDFPVEVDISLLGGMLGVNEDVKSLNNIINVAGGFSDFIKKVRANETARTPNLKSIDAILFDKVETIQNYVGDVVGKVDKVSGVIKNAAERVVGVLTDLNEIETPDGTTLINSVGDNVNSLGDVNSPPTPLNGHNVDTNGMPDQNAVPPTSFAALPTTSPTTIPNRYIPEVGSPNPENWTPSPKMEKYLFQLNWFFASITLDIDLCSKIDNPFAQISSLVGLSVNDLNFDLQTQVVNPEAINPGSSVDEEYAEYDKAINATLKKIDSLRTANLRIVESSTDRLNRFIDSTTSNGPRLYSFFMKKHSQLTEFFGVKSVENLKRKVAAIATANRMQFEKSVDKATTEPIAYDEVLNILLINLCNLTVYIDYYFKKKSDDYKNLVTRVTDTFKIQELKSYNVSKQALDAGAIRLNPRERISEAASHAEIFNSNSVSEKSTDDTNTSIIQPMKHISRPATKDEKSAILSLTEEGTSEFSFDTSIVQMGYIAKEFFLRGGNGIKGHEKQYNPTQNYYESGWHMLVEKQPNIYAMLIRTIKRLQDDGELGGILKLNSCYRSPYYNRIYLKEYKKLNASWNSTHMSALAIDISTTGLSNLGVARLIQYASQEGFNRISVYSTFVHMDIQDGSYRGNWTKYYRNNADIETAMKLHLTKQHTDGRKT